jgi:hypothetical protein
MSSFLSAFHVVSVLGLRLFLLQYNVRLIYQIKMLRSRIDDSKIISTDAKQVELTPLDTQIDHDIADVMLVFNPATYRRWLRRNGSNQESRDAPKLLWRP